MTFQGDESGRGTADVRREAANLVDAVLSAIRDVELLSGLRVVEVERQDFVSLTDIARRLNRTTESVRLLATWPRAGDQGLSIAGCQAKARSALEVGGGR